VNGAVQRPARKRPLLWLLAALVLSCDPFSQENGGNGAVSVAVNLSALQASDVTRASLTVSSGASVVAWADLGESLPGQWSGLMVGIPSGTNYTFTVELFDSNNVALYSGSAATSVLIGQTVTLSILAEPVSPPPQPVVSMPVIDLLTASGISAVEGSQITLSVQAHDPSGGTLSYSWTDSCGGGFTPPDTPTTIWTAPPGVPASPCDLVLQVENSAASVTVDLLVQVTAS